MVNLLKRLHNMHHTQRLFILFHCHNLLLIKLLYNRKLVQNGLPNASVFFIIMFLNGCKERRIFYRPEMKTGIFKIEYFSSLPHFK